VTLREPVFGKVYNESMCLSQSTEISFKRSLLTGKLCVEKLPFIYSHDRIDLTGNDARVQGTVGISPLKSEHNYVWRLYNAGQIDKPIVGINYQKWGDYFKESTVEFGKVDFDKVQVVKESVSQYKNFAKEHWGLLLDNFMYNGQKMTDYD